MKSARKYEKEPETVLTWMISSASYSGGSQQGERERAEGREHLHRIHLDHAPAIFNVGRPLTWTVVGRNFKSLVGQIEVGHFNGQGKVGDLLLGVESELCRVKDNWLF